MNAINESHEFPRAAAVAAPHATHTYKMLLKREFWEHKGGFLWAPLVAGGILLLLTLMGIGAGEVNVLDLHEALERLSQKDSRKGRIVELKFFGGLTTDEIAATLRISAATVERDWKFARAWLYGAIAGER